MHGVRDEGHSSFFNVSFVVDANFNDIVTLVGRRKTGRGTKQATGIEETTRGTVDLLAAMKKKRKG